MTVEQALVYFLAAVAAVFLFLGLAQALDDRPPRPRRHRPPREPRLAGPGPADEDVHGALWSPTRSVADRAAPRVAPTGGVAPDPGPAGEDAPSVEPPPMREPPSVAAPVASEVTVERWHDRREAAVADVEPVEPVPRVDAAPVVAAAPAVEVPAPPVVVPDPPRPRPEPARAPKRAAARPPADPDMVLIERAVDHCLGGRHEDLLASVESRMDQGAQAGAERASHVMTALCSLAGLAHDGLGDAPGARGAFAAGVRSMPDPDALACPPRLAALSVRVARALLDLAARPAVPAAPRPDAQVDAARLATFWVGWRLHAAPGDEESLALLEAARDTVADAHADAAGALMARHEYAGARAAVQRGLDAGELPAARGEVLLELLGATFRREIDRLTATAIRGGRDEGRAVTGLGQAEAMVAALPEGTIGAAHRAAVAQRIWRAHSKLGFRRLRLGQLDAAADTLFRALAVREIGRRRQRQVRDALVRTLEGLGDQRAAAVAALVAEGKQPAAAEEIARLEFRMRRAREEGVSDEELEVAASKIEQLRRALDAPSATAR